MFINTVNKGSYEGRSKTKNVDVNKGMENYQIMTVKKVLSKGLIQFKSHFCQWFIKILNS